MKVLYRALFVCVAILYFTEVTATRFVVQHKSSKKYIARHSGVFEAYATLTSIPQDAQEFKILPTDGGSIMFVTDDGKNALDKKGGCDHPDPRLEYFDAFGSDNQLFTLNNMGTLGSRCCDTCLVVPDADYKYLVIRNYTCIYESNDNWQFTITAVSKS